MQPKEQKNEGTILSAAAQSASYNIVLQLVLRAVSFLLNAFVLRFITRDLLGVVSVRLTLLYSTVLFVGREAIRKACLTKQQPHLEQWDDAINIMWCSPIIGSLCALSLSYAWLYHLEQPDVDAVPYYWVGVVTFALAAVVELLAEPFWFVGQKLLFVKLKVVVEGLAMAMKSLLTVLLIYTVPHWGVQCFGIAQVFFAVIYSVSYIGFFVVLMKKNKKNDKEFPIKTLRDFFPKLSHTKPAVDRNLALLTWSFLKQSSLKQLLTEGERYVMTVFSVLTFGDQGVYDLINNLGSLVPRFLFCPIEESAYLFFSQTVTRGVLAKDQTKQSAELAASVLDNLLRLVTLMGCTILVFGHAYSLLALDIYGGALLSTGTGPNLLQWYCIYVLLLALNGMSECFAFAVMSQANVDKYNYKMLLFSILFLASSLCLASTFGSVGFIWANCLNMLARTIHSFRVISMHHKDTDYRPWRGIIPCGAVLFSLAVAFFLTSVSEVVLCCDHGLLGRVLHVAVGGASLAGVLFVVYTQEKNLVDFIYSKCIPQRWRSKKMS